MDMKIGVKLQNHPPPQNGPLTHSKRNENLSSSPCPGDILITPQSTISRVDFIICKILYSPKNCVVFSKVILNKIETLILFRTHEMALNFNPNPVLATQRSEKKQRSNSNPWNKRTWKKCKIKRTGFYIFLVFIEIIFVSFSQMSEII